MTPWRCSGFRTWQDIRKGPNFKKTWDDSVGVVYAVEFLLPGSSKRNYGVLAHCLRVSLSLVGVATQ